MHGMLATPGLLDASLSFRPAGPITTSFDSMCNMAVNIDIKKRKVLCVDIHYKVKMMRYLSKAVGATSGSCPLSSTLIINV
eukprot:6352932-Ditylum_brightwellii.AAC.1